MLLVIGSYEQMLLGYAVREGKKGDLEWEEAFTDHSHSGCIKTIASTGTVLASGSTDERICLFNIKENQEMGILCGHEGTISRLAIYEEHMLSAAEDGTVRIWSLEDWEEIKALKHSAPVRDFSADPSGKLLLTIANDKTLRAWDLAKGREAFTKSFRDQPERVLWGPDGRRYALQLTASMMQIQTLEESKEKVQIESKDRIMDIKFFSESEIAVGLSSGRVELWRIEKGNNNRDVGVKTATIEAHSSRIKGMAICNGLLFTGDSSGSVCAFDKTGKKVMHLETEARITCLAVAPEKEENGNEKPQVEHIQQEQTSKRRSKGDKRRKSKNGANKHREDRG